MAVKSVESMTGNLEAFITDLGLAPMVGLSGNPGELGAMIPAMAMLGDGFDPSGGFAVALSGGLGGSVSVAVGGRAGGGGAGGEVEVESASAITTRELRSGS